jgi:cytoskeletal protein CcmA (bactofilin family)
MVWRRKRESEAYKVVSTEAALADHLDSEVSGDLPAGAVVQGVARDMWAVASSNSDRLGSFLQSFDRRPYIVPRGYKISGGLFSARTVLVEGELVGVDLVAQQVCVAPGGLLRGGARVGVLVCQGSVEAELVATKSVEITSSASVSGSVTAPQVRVERGAQLHNARLRINS